VFPGVDGFHWTFAHVIFLTAFFGVAVAIVTTVLMAIRGAARDLRNGQADAICWREDFAELPTAERCCRHQLAGRVADRTCPNAFDCAHCPDYPRFAALPAAVAPRTFGLNYPEDRFYHRGHTWVRPESDGTVTIGLDDLAQRVIGEPDSVDLPAPGAEIRLQGTAWKVKKNGLQVRVRAPLDGTVEASGGPAQGWYLQVRPRGTADLRPLLRGPEVTGWLSRELERMQIGLARPEGSPALTDGGVLVNGLMDALPEADWETVLAGTFLEP
jgi:glycine cleavage system H lipoate-binding protein